MCFNRRNDRDDGFCVTLELAVVAVAAFVFVEVHIAVAAIVAYVAHDAVVIVVVYEIHFAVTIAVTHF